jgi:hypothetical protein
MRPWKTLLALSLLATFTNRPAFAVFAHGLEALPLGGALVTSPPDESSLLLSNIGSSGQDGVSIQLQDAFGNRIVSSSTWSSSDVGVVLSFGWEQVSGPTVDVHTLDLERTATGVTLSGSLIVFGGTESRTIMCFLGNDLVRSSVVTSSGPLQLEMPPGVDSQVPVVDLDGDPREDLLVCSVRCPTGVTLSLGGSPVVCDRIVVVRITPNDGFVEGFSLRVTNPPGGTFSSLDISSQALSRSGSLLVSQGQLHFSSSSSGSMLFEIGSQGSDGVFVTQSLSSRLSSLLRSMPTSPVAFALPGQCASSRMSFAPGSLVLTPGTDAGASLRCDVMASSSCSPDNVLASLTTLVRSSDLLLSSRFSSMCADEESVYVSRKGQLVLAQAIALDGSVVVTSPPASPLGMAINEKGLPGDKPRKKNKATHQAMPGAGGLRSPVDDADPSLVVGDEPVFLSISFADVRTIDVGGTLVLGDEVAFSGRNSAGGSGTVLTVIGTNFGFARSSTGTQAPSSVEVQQVSTSGGDDVSAVTSPGSVLGPASPVVQVPVVLSRSSSSTTQPLRGFSVQFQLSSNAVLAGPPVEFDHLSSSGTTQMFTIDEGGGRYTVDCVILGAGCGPTDGGTLFTIPVSAAVGVSSGTATVTLTRLQLADCINDPIGSSLGSNADVPIDFVAPSPPTLTATQVTTGNGASGTTRILLVPSGTLSLGESYAFFRAPYGNYPEYDDGPSPGSVPTVPSYPPPPTWSLVSFQLGALATEDYVDVRDFHYYVCYTVDGGGNWSSPSNRTDGTLSYHLGDVSDGVSSCSDDNQVSTADLSALGASYGATLSYGSPLACLDVGPTSNRRTSGRPLTDDRLNFDDLVLFAMNYLLVSRPGERTSPAPGPANLLSLEVPALPAEGGTIEAVLRMSGAGDALGVSASLDWDASVLEFLGAVPGELVSRQDRQGVVFAAGRHVDAALLGPGSGFSGEGELARVRFRVRGAGEPRLALVAGIGRDVRNEDVLVNALASSEPAPARTQLRMAFPNPFGQATNVVFSLRTAGHASVGVFDVAGRHVRTLANGVRPAGTHTLAWDGRTDDGTRAGAGVYLIRLQAGGVRETRVVRFVP